MLSGLEAESDLIRSGCGICDTRVRYSYRCHAKSRSDRILIRSGLTPAILR